MAIAGILLARVVILLALYVLATYFTRWRSTNTEASVTPRFSVGDFIAVTNQAFENIYPAVEIEGEVGSFKVNQGKYVFLTQRRRG